MKLKNLFLILCLVFATADAAEDMNRKLWANCLATALEIPYVLAFDSTDPDTIQLTTGIEALANALKAINLGVSLIEKEDRGLIRSFFELLKTSIYASAFLDSIKAFDDSEEKAQENKKFNDVLVNHKKSQEISLLWEACLRGIALYYHSKDEADVTGIATELGDVIGIVRLLDRYPNMHDEVHQSIC